MRVTKQINYCPPASPRPAHISWVNLAFEDQQPDDEGQQPLAQPQPGGMGLTYFSGTAMTLPITYLTRYRLTAN